MKGEVCKMLLPRRGKASGSPEPLPLKANRAPEDPTSKATRKCGSSTLVKDTTLVLEMPTILVGNKHHGVQGWQRCGDAERLVLVVRS